MKCPECGSTYQFVVDTDIGDAYTVDSNCNDLEGNPIDVLDFAECECVDCGYTADVEDFQEADAYEDLDDDVDAALDTDSLMYDCRDSNDSPGSELDDVDADIFEEYKDYQDSDDEDWD